jgi:hypothetical protein
MGCPITLVQGQGSSACGSRFESAAHQGSVELRGGNTPDEGGKFALETLAPNRPDSEGLISVPGNMSGGDLVEASLRLDDRPIDTRLRAKPAGNDDRERSPTVSTRLTRSKGFKRTDLGRAV